MVLHGSGRGIFTSAAFHKYCQPPPRPSPGARTFSPRRHDAGATGRQNGGAPGNAAPPRIAFYLHLNRLIVTVVALVATAASAASIDTVRGNLVSYYSADGADRTSPRVHDALSALEASARSYVQLLRSDGSFSDINYDEVPSGSWSPWDHTRRLIVLAKAYRTQGQPLYNDPQLRAEIESALDYVNHYYSRTTLPLGNWWFWSIGVPLDLGPTLVLMRGAINDTVFNNCVSTLAFHIGSSPTSRGLTGPVPTGENLVWSSFTHLCLALLRDDPVLMAQVRDAMAAVCLTTTGDGIQSDSSFHQHGPQLYTGGYGGSFANDVARYALLTRNTEFQLMPSALSSFANYLADGVAWSLYGNYFDVSVVGREVARSSTTGFNGIAALLQAATVPSLRQPEIRAAAAKMLQSWHWVLPPELAALAHDGLAGVWPSGHQHYYASDYTVHRRSSWFASIKMFSTRTKSGESTNDENLLGSRQSDGRFYLSLSGDDYFGRDIWPAFDWTRLPGITVEQKPDAASDFYDFGTRAFVGGVGDPQNGVSAMDYAPLRSSVTAKKAWFFFDDTLVFLTNNINSKSGNRIETVIDQRPITSSPVSGINWTVANGVGYWFYGATPHVEQIARTGAWADLGGSTDTTPHSATLTTIWLDHGTAPVNADASYAIIPNATASSMRTFVPPSIIANDANASAVQRGNTTGIVFWAAGKVAGVQSDSPAIVYLTPTDLYVTDPSGSTGTFTITLPNGKFSVARNGGRTFHAKLTPSRRRAIR
jgi:chondroitin AC lyase